MKDSFKTAVEVSTVFAMIVVPVAIVVVLVALVFVQ